MAGGQGEADDRQVVIFIEARQATAKDLASTGAPAAPPADPERDKAVDRCRKLDRLAKSLQTYPVGTDPLTMRPSTVATAIGRLIRKIQRQLATSSTARPSQNRRRRTGRAALGGSSSPLLN